MAYGFVYRTTNTVNGMMYIGKCEYNRKNGWESYIGSGVYLKRAVSVYGKDAFKREILAEANSAHDLEAKEEGLIHYYDAVNDPLYYNLKQTSIGGDTFTTHPEKETIREAHRSNALGPNNNQCDKQKTDKMIQSVRKANSKKVVVGGTLYGSVSEASIATGIKGTTIHYRLDRDSFPDYVRVEPKRDMTGAKRNNVKQPVIIDGVRYESYKSASIANNCSPTKVRIRVAHPQFPNWKIA